MNIEKTGILLKKIHFARLAGILILVNLILLVLLVIPRRSVIVTKQEQYAKLREQAATDQAEVKNLKSRVEALQRAQQDLKKIYSEILLTRKQGVLAIRLEIEDLARGMAVKRQDFNYDYKDLPEFRLQEFTLSVPVEGSYRDIRRMINSIERSQHFLILDRVNLSAENKSEDLTLDFKLSTYLVQNEK